MFSCRRRLKKNVVTRQIDIPPSVGSCLSIFIPDFGSVEETKGFEIITFVLGFKTPISVDFLLYQKKISDSMLLCLSGFLSFGNILSKKKHFVSVFIFLINYIELLITCPCQNKYFSLILQEFWIVGWFNIGWQKISSSQIESKNTLFNSS